MSYDEMIEALDRAIAFCESLYEGIEINMIDEIVAQRRAAELRDVRAQLDEDVDVACGRAE